MKKIALFGGSGQTGQLFLALALANGFAVNALARNPKSIAQSNPNLVVFAGDVLNADDVQQVIDGTDIVVSLFGHVKG